jgi:hypothetical protein
LVAALFRLAEEPLISGRVMLDGVDLATLCLRDVRARKPRGVVVIPQVAPSYLSLSLGFSPF